MKQYDKVVLLSAEQLRLFYKGMGFGALATLLLAWAIVETAGGLGNDAVFVWSVAIGLVSIGQLMLWYLWRSVKPGPSVSRNWRYYPLPLSLFGGICWGVAAVYPYPDYSAGFDLLPVLIAACGVQLMLMLQSSLLPALVIFVLGLLVPMVMAFQSSAEHPSPDQVLVIGTVVVLISLTAVAFARLMMWMSNLHAGREILELMLQMEGDENVEQQRKMEERDSNSRDLERELFLEKEAVESAAMAKSEFLATMSHEIRTPLNGIVPVLEMLGDTRLDQEQKQFVSTALASSHHLLGIINDILDFSKIEAGRLQVEKIPFDVWELVNSVSAVMLGHAQKKNLDLQYLVSNDVPPVIQGDPIRLRQVLVNLVSNAIKFTQEGSITLEVSLKSEHGIGEQLMFSVKDTGIGISSETISHLFQSFSQADASTTRRHGGTGLGLVICKGLVELMGGQINVRSKPAAGSVFWFVLPLERAVSEEVSREAVPGSRFTPVFGSEEELPVPESEPVFHEVPVEPQLSGIVLVVEDNPVNLGVARKMLQRLGLTCDAVTDGKSAVTAASGSRYDLILMDCQMPIMDGYEATRLIRQRERGKDAPQVPIIAMTANAMAGDREKCIEAGMDDYLSKPVVLDTLGKTLGYWLRVHESPQPVQPVQGKTRRFTRSLTGKRGTAAANESEDAPSIVDKEVLRNLYYVMGDDFVGLIESYMAHVPQLMGEIRAGIEARDLSQVIRPVHSLKSSSANVGAMRLSSVAREMEEDARTGEQDKVIAGLAGLEHEYEVSNGALKTIDSNFFE